MRGFRVNLKPDFQEIMLVLKYHYFYYYFIFNYYNYYSAINKILCYYYILTTQGVNNYCNLFAMTPLKHGEKQFLIHNTHYTVNIELTRIKSKKNPGKDLFLQ